MLRQFKLLLIIISACLIATPSTPAAANAVGCHGGVTFTPGTGAPVTDFLSPEMIEALKAAAPDLLNANLGDEWHVCVPYAQSAGTDSASAAGLHQQFQGQLQPVGDQLAPFMDSVEGCTDPLMCDRVVVEETVRVGTVLNPLNLGSMVAWETFAGGYVVSHRRTPVPQLDQTVKFSHFHTGGQIPVQVDATSQACHPDYCSWATNWRTKDGYQQFQWVEAGSVTIPPSITLGQHFTTDFTAVSAARVTDSYETSNKLCVYAVIDMPSGEDTTGPCNFDQPPAPASLPTLR